MVVKGDRLYSAQQIADKLGVAEKTVRRWIEKGDLHAERRGRRFAIRLADAERVYAASGSVLAVRGDEAAHDAAQATQELAELRGRYAEAKERIEQLEAMLATEQRRSIALEMRLEMLTASDRTPVRIASG